MKILTGTLALALTMALSANFVLADPDQAPRLGQPNSTTHGKTLAEWIGAYWTWSYSGIPASGEMDGVKFMPLPAGTQTSGSWTPADPAYLQGQLEITVEPGTPFVLPLFAWVGERYNNGTPDDPPMDNAVALASADITLSIDGKVLISNQNKAEFYVPVTYFPEMVQYPAPSSYGSIGALFFQGVGFVSPPLSVGTHVIHLLEPLIIPAGAYSGLPAGLGIIYDNTWVIKVVPKGKAAASAE